MGSNNDISLKALAKINLGLDVVRRREDGYHEVRMIMQTIHLYDRLDIKRTKEPGIQIQTNLSFLPVNENNLIYKAAKLLMDEFSITDGVSVKPAVFASDLSVFASCFFEAVLVFFVCASSFAVTLCAATAETTLEIASNISHPSLVMCVRESFPAILLSTCIASDIAKQSFSYIVYRLFCVCCL